MSRGKGMLFALVALLAVGTMTVTPAMAVTKSGAVAATDERAPAPVTGVIGIQGVSGVEISWDLSPSDFVRSSPTGNDFTSGGTFPNVNDVAGYNVYRDGTLAGSSAAGEMLFIDLEAVGSAISYTVTAYDKAGNESAESDPVIVSLGPPPVAGISLPTGDFGIVDPDTPVTQDVGIANGATAVGATLTYTVAVTGEGFSADVATGTVDPAGSAVVAITFDPAVVSNVNAVYAGSLRIRTNDADNREVTLTLAAEIVNGVGLPAISVVPTSVAFGQGVLNTAATRRIRISNTGGPTLTGTATLTGDAAFTLTGGSFSLDVNGVDTLTVTFTPTAVTSYLGTLTINSNDAATPTVTVAITGQGVEQLSGPGTVVATVAKATVAVQRTVDLADPVAKQSFLDAFIARIAQILGISPGRIKINNVTNGSTIVEFTIEQTGGTATEPSATAAVATLVTTITTAVSDTTVTDPLADFGGSKEVVNQTATVSLVPTDGDGIKILGWFTLGAYGNQVGFDDFFAFADRFGSTSADVTFDATYDIASSGSSEPDGKVDFDDFFVFADNFGKTVANADAIIAALQ